MPSSPGPNEYRRSPSRFVYRGISLTPQDALPEGKIAYGINIRSRMEGTIEPRYGLCRVTDTPLGDAIHSLFRLNDPTPFGVAEPAVRFLGSSGNLAALPLGDTTPSTIDTGYSGDALTAITAAPFRSPRPWIYIADSARMRKFSTDLTPTSIGLPPPPNPPSARLTEPQLTYLNPVETEPYVGYGGQTPAGAVPTINRVNTLVTNILYDTGTTGMASVTLGDMTNVNIGAVMDIGAAPERVAVQDVLPPVGPTTIAAILYDSGNTGLCTIQPEGSFSLGQIEAPIPAEIRRRYEKLNEPLPPRISVYRTIDYPVNALVLLGGVELVRILSVAIGPDGVQSFRCSTAGTFGATAAIAGIASFRAWFNTTKAPGDGVGEVALDTTITPTDATSLFIGGVQANIGPPERDWSRVGTQATQPEDIIEMGFMSDQLGYVESVRIVLDVRTSGDVFLENYYLYEWRANDLLTAIQSAAQLTTGLMKDAQSAAVDQGITDTFYEDQYGRGVTPGGYRRGTTVPSDRTAQPKDDGVVTVGSGLSRQLALGNNQWLTLQCRVGDLTRVGTDTSRTLQHLGAVAFMVQVRGTTNPIIVRFSDAYLMGGYGPDVGPTNAPYVYRYRYRSTITGERGNPSPSMRAGVTPRRGRVALEADASSEPQCDVIDWFRFGGALARWAYVMTTPNSGSPVTDDDDMADRQIDGGEPLRTDLFQPWPTSDLPRSGTCNVAGTAIEWASGDAFDTRWAPDSAIIIDGRATQLYQSPASTTRLDVIDNCGSGSGVSFTLPAPTLLAQPLPSIWGGPINDVWFHFACGDVNDPGSVYWSNGNDPDSTSDANWLMVTSASEPLVHGFYVDGVPYVWSTERLFRLIPTFGDVTTFRAVETACSRGLWNRQAFVVSPESLICFLEKAGISASSGGSNSQSIVDPDLRPIFPQDGTIPEETRGIAPMSLCQAIHFTWVDQILYVDYTALDGTYQTLLWEPLYQRWTPDTYGMAGATSRIWETGTTIHTHLIGGSDGHLYQMDALQMTDAGEDIPWAAWTPWANGEDARALKQWGDAVIDLHAGYSVNGITVTPVVDNGNVSYPPFIVGLGGSVRQTYIVDVASGGGVISRTFGLQVTGTMISDDTQRPLLYLWEPSWLPKGTSVARRATDWEDLGYKGAKFVQGVIIRANTFNTTKQLQVQYDGNTALTLNLLHDGEEQIAYPLSSAGWTPFIGELVRLLGADENEWSLLDWRWIWEPAPELATQWETQYTTFDYPGFLHVHDGIVAYQSTAPVYWFIEYQDGSSATYTLADSGGLYRRIRQITEAQKGKAVRFRWTSTEPFRLFKKDCSVRAQAWGAPGGFQTQMPFGGASREDGAGI